MNVHTVLTGKPFSLVGGINVYRYNEENEQIEVFTTHIGYSWYANVEYYATDYLLIKTVIGFRKIYFRNVR